MNMKDNTSDFLREMYAWLTAVEDVWQYYLQKSFPLWEENKKQAAEINKLKVNTPEYLRIVILI